MKFLPIFGLVLFIYILSKVNLEAVKDNFLRMDVRFLLLAFALTLPSLFIKTLKWKQLINPFKVKISWVEGFAAWVAAFFIGLITPGRIGDLARAFYLKEKMPVGKALTTVVVDRILDVLILMILSITGMAFVISHFVVKSRIPLFITIIFLLLVVAGLFFLKKERAAKFFKPLFNFFVPDKYKEKLKTHFGEFYEGINLLMDNKIAVLKSALLSFIAWWVVSLQYYLIAKAMGVGINYFILFMILPTVILVEILPISFSGLGTRDATLILFFSFVGLTKDAAVALSLSILMFSYIYSLVGLAVWIRKPIKL